MSAASAMKDDGLPGGRNRWKTGMNKGNCTCSKTKCIKLYCECFNAGKYCNKDCVCSDCRNAEEYDVEGGVRYETMSHILFRKPDAFDEETRARIIPKDPKNKKKGSGKRSDKIPISAAKTKAKPGRRKKNADKERIELVASKHQAIEFSPEEFPQLTMDDVDHSALAGAFNKPLFTEPSRPLEIAYSHQTKMDYQKKIAQQKKALMAKECKQLREKLQEKKLALSLAIDEVNECDKELGAWTQKVFDLELEEPCEWNANYQKLYAFKEQHGKLPSKKSQEEEEKSLYAWLDSVRHEKNEENDEDEDDDDEKKGNKNKRLIDDYPHRMQRLESLGVNFGRRRDDTFDAMLQKLLEYKEEHGTIRFLSDEMCERSKNAELQSLQKWVKAQVVGFRNGKLSPDAIKQLNDIGFSFDKWCIGKAKRTPKKQRMLVQKQEETSEDGGVAVSLDV